MHIYFQEIPPDPERQIKLNKKFGSKIFKSILNLTFNLVDSAALWFTGVGNAVETPRWQGTIIDYNNCEAYFGGGMLNANLQATGFLLKASAGTITGEVAVYGLAK